MKPRSIALLVLMASILGAVAGALGVQLTRPAPQVRPPLDWPATVSALGRLEPDGEIVEVGGPAGARVDRLETVAREGGRVRQGDVLAYLDSHAEMAAARNHAAIELAEAERGRRAETESGRAAVDDAKLGIRRADQAMRLRIEAQDADVRRSSFELEKLRGDLQRAEKLRAGGAILQNQYDEAVLAVRRGEEILSRNRATLAELQEERDIQLQSSRDGLRSAEAGQVRGELSARVQTLAQALKLAETRVELARIRAPVSGEILQIVTHPGEAIHGQPILKMGNTDSMVAVAEVYETDVRFVRVGQKATITSRALTQPIAGRVERIGTLIHKSDVLGIDPTAEVDARVIEVRIRLDADPTVGRYNRHQVDVTIQTAEPGAAAPIATTPPTSGR